MSGCLGVTGARLGKAWLGPCVVLGCQAGVLILSETPGSLWRTVEQDLGYFSKMVLWCFPGQSGKAAKQHLRVVL